MGRAAPPDRRDAVATQTGRPTAIDLFSGAGGATQGLADAGFDVIGAVEFDAIAAESYRLNHPAVRLWEQDIKTLTAIGVGRELRLAPGELGLLKACPPCQGFSSLAECQRGQLRRPAEAEEADHPCAARLALDTARLVVSGGPGGTEDGTANIRPAVLRGRR